MKRVERVKECLNNSFNDFNNNSAYLLQRLCLELEELRTKYPNLASIHGNKKDNYLEISRNVVANEYLDFIVTSKMVCDKFKDDLMNNEDCLTFHIIKSSINFLSNATHFGSNFAIAKGHEDKKGVQYLLIVARIDSLIEGLKNYKGVLKSEVVSERGR
jgi:hypothetical protein